MKAEDILNKIKTKPREPETMGNVPMVNLEDSE